MMGINGAKIKAYEGLSGRTQLQVAIVLFDVM